MRIMHLFVNNAKNAFVLELEDLAIYGFILSRTFSVYTIILRIKYLPFINRAIYDSHVSRNHL